MRGFGVMARAVGLVGHILEESEHPMALEVWQRIDEEASAHAGRNATSDPPMPLPALLQDALRLPVIGAPLFRARIATGAA